MHQFLKFTLEWNSACFGQFLCPSSGVFHCTQGNGICHTGLLTACSQAVSKPVWHIPLPCVQWKTPDDGQRNCPKHAEFHSKVNLRNWCIQLVYYKKFIMMHGHMNVKFGTGSFLSLSPPPCPSPCLHWFSPVTNIPSLLSTNNYPSPFSLYIPSNWQHQ